MKSSYKIYGTFWNQKDIIYKDYQMQIMNENLQTEDNITISEILSTEHPETINRLNHTKLLLDYIPNNEAEIVWDFYIKRLLQMANYYNVEVIICEDEQQLEKVKTAITNYCKKRTPKRLLAQSNGVLQMIC
ncbi:hypothetical protein [Butyrivibrio fibrisolvens]|uniref:hypothetical protein n=1 Tax=Butyrivibrio fibrisolvens TaxID=831 RepID=UPI000480843E|nr:hypothetical protein [Butyrivibrio fibrisolvens]